MAKAAALEDDAPMDSKDPNAGGDKALNKLFQTLYADATDEQKKAMIKSYQESNGTALSTDWNEVKKASLFDVLDPLLTLRAGNGRDQAARGMTYPLSTCGIGELTRPVAEHDREEVVGTSRSIAMDSYVLEHLLVA